MKKQTVLSTIRLQIGETNVLNILSKKISN